MKFDLFSSQGLSDEISARFFMKDLASQTDESEIVQVKELTRAVHQMLQVELPIIV